MPAVEMALRAVGYAAAMLLFGASLFAVYAPKRIERALCARLQAVSAVVALASTATWIAVHTAVVSGQPIDDVVAGSALMTALRYTKFGHVGLLRMLLLASFPFVPATRPVVRVALSGAIIASLAWSGHAVATPGYAHVAADAVHLLAAAAWTGGLVPFAHALARAPRPECVALTARFSRLGMVCVAALLATGFVNAWFLVARPSALYETAYGRVLSVKLALFAAMVVLAIVNRVRLTPRLPDAAAARRIAANATVEAALAVAIVIAVAALGMMVPAAHSTMHVH